MPEDPLAEAKAALDSGDVARARGLVDRAFEERPEDRDVRELYTALHLAEAIRLAAAAREARRADVMRRDIPYEEEFQDNPEVAKAFDAALAAVDAVLAADPRHEKALTVKASILFRRERATGRPAALEILRAVAAANPGNRQVGTAIKRIERPCPRCSDTGFCPYCRGRGSKRFLSLERRCGTCHGQGICLACGVL